MMNFETSTEEKNKKEKSSLYPERASAYLSEPIEKIKKLEKGEGVLELSEKEKEALFRFENELGEELEDIFKIKPISQTFYPEYFLTDEGRKVVLEKKKAGMINDKQIEKQLKNRLKIAIKSTRRLFRGGADLNSKNMPLLKSKDTVYLEQRAIMDILKKEGMEKYAFVLGINLDTLATLIEIGVVNPDKIQEPKMYTLKIWDRIKDKYKLAGN